MKAKKTKAKKAIRKVTKRVAKKAKAKPRKRSAALNATMHVEIHRDAIMHQVEELVKATAMNGGIIADNESKMIDIENAVRDALGEPHVSSRSSLAAHIPALAA
jgi:hypothetical protein